MYNFSKTTLESIFYEQRKLCGLADRTEIDNYNNPSFSVANPNSKKVDSLNQICP